MAAHAQPNRRKETCGWRRDSKACLKTDMPAPCGRTSDFTIRFVESAEPRRSGARLDNSCSFFESGSRRELGLRDVLRRHIAGLD